MKWKKREEDAVQIYRTILEKDPENVLVRDRLGQIYITQKKLDQALEQLKTLGKISGSDAIQVHLKIGLIYLEQKRFESAIQEFLIVLAAYPDEERVRYFLGSAYAENGEEEAAKAAFLRISPEAEIYPESRVFLAYLFEEEGKLDEAIAVIEEALKHKPERDKFWGFLGILYEKKEDYKQAVHDIPVFRPDLQRSLDQLLRFHEFNPLLGIGISEIIQGLGIFRFQGYGCFQGFDTLRLIALFVIQHAK